MAGPGPGPTDGKTDPRFGLFLSLTENLVAWSKLLAKVLKSDGHGTRRRLKGKPTRGYYVQREYHNAKTDAP